MWLPEEDKYNMRKNEILASLIVDMGGRVAEEIVFGDVTSGASGDIKMATDLARKMVCQWGMSEELGMVEYGEHNEHVFLARDVSHTRSYSEDTAQKIDREVKRLIDNAYNKAKSMLMEHRSDLDLIAQALLEFETLDGNHIRDILSHGEMKDPPASPKPPEPPEETKVAKEQSTDERPKEDGGFGDLAPASA
jgi:cell division protease FtsH